MITKSTVLFLIDNYWYSFSMGDIIILTIESMVMKIINYLFYLNFNFLFLFLGIMRSKLKKF